MNTNVQTWECGAENASDVIATLNGGTLIISGKGTMKDFSYWRHYENDEYHNKIHYTDRNEVGNYRIGEKFENDIPYGAFICYSRQNEIPWKEKIIKSVRIEEGITSIGDCAFLECYGLTSVTIPPSITRIGRGAFMFCRGLESIDLPQNMNIVETFAFRGCLNLKIKCHKEYSKEIFSSNTFLSKDSLNKEFIEERILKNAILYVPVNSESSYKHDPNLAGFQKLGGKVLAIDDTPEQIDELISAKRQKIEKLEQEIKDLEERKNTNYPIEHEAPRLIELLKNFSVNDKSLKYATHSWEYGKFDSYNDFLNKIAEEWGKISGDLKKLNENLHTKIADFLFNKDLGKKRDENEEYFSWGEKKLKFGWSSPALKDYMNSSDKKDPFTCPIPDEIRELDKYPLFYFADYVSVFKNEIEIREDNNALERLLNDLWGKVLSYDFVLEQKNTKGISFFTDVKRFKSTIELIFKNCKVRPEHPNIIVTVETDFIKSKTILLKITQKDSECNRDINDIKISHPSGDLKTITDNIKNLADFSIESHFPKNKENYRINYVTSIENINRVEPLADSCDGFTYILKFYL